MPHSIDSPQALAAQVRNRFLRQAFGAIRFWRFAVVRPHDQSYWLTDAQGEGQRLDLLFQHASGQGHIGVIAVWDPAGLSLTPQGLVLAQASRLTLDDNDAFAQGSQYRIRTARGEGNFPIDHSPALTLEV